MFGFIYLTINNVNNKKYIGMCSSKHRFKSYLGSGILLKQAIEKYGKNNFSRQILEECHNEEDLRIAEAKWIAKYDALNSEEFYNLCEGGRGGATIYGRSTSAQTKLQWSKKTKEERKEIINKSIANRRSYSGSDNPKASPVIINDKYYGSLKDALLDYPHIPYSSLKSAAQNGYSKKYNLRIIYAKKRKGGSV